MKVLVLGGYGVFGERLAKLLLIDGHNVCIAGRNAYKAQTCANLLECSFLQMDRNGDLSALKDYDVVVDAAGPFHTYGDDPYRLPRAAIQANTHYLDLADTADFCAGISQLDSLARASKVCVLSGLSSVPALSSAAVRALCGEQRPEVIDTAIIPGNRAPRGMSVMHSILSQAGRPIPIWIANQWRTTYGWSNPKRYSLPGGLTRQAWHIQVPDQLLFPAYFGAHTVHFRAGLELAVMRYGLAAFARIRRIFPFIVTRPIVRVFKIAADLLSPFGTGEGGMSVSVIVGQEHRTWSLVAQDGDGPFIPTIATRALLRTAHLPIGAGPALDVVTLNQAEEAMADLNVKTTRASRTISPLFARALGADFEALPEKIKETHTTSETSLWVGTSSVERGKSLWARLLCTLFRFPPTAKNLDVEVAKTLTPHGETWTRRFGNHTFRSHLSVNKDGLCERFGPFVFSIDLKRHDQELHYPVKAGRAGPFSLPHWLLPVSITREFVEQDIFHFDVALFTPVTNKEMVRYRGYLHPKCAPSKTTARQ